MSPEITTAGAITALVAEKRAVGYKYAAEERVLARFAAFCCAITASVRGNNNPGPKPGSGFKYRAQSLDGIASLDRMASLEGLMEATTRIELV